MSNLVLSIISAVATLLTSSVSNSIDSVTSLIVKSATTLYLLLFTLVHSVILT